MQANGEQLTNLNGVRQWVRVAGAAKATVPLVLIHGGPGGNHFVFEQTAGPLLDARKTVVYHEQRGSGRSEAPANPAAYSVPLLVEDLRALIQHLNAPQVDLLGYSFGGGLALEFARAHSTLVRRVVAQAPAFHLSAPEIVAAQLAGFRRVAQGGVLAEIEQILRTTLSDTEKLEQLWSVADTPTVDRFLFQSETWAAFNRRLWAESGLGNSGEMHRALQAQPPSDTPEQLHEITAPTLVLTGRFDRNVPLAWSQQVAGALPNAHLAVFEHSAHFPDIEESFLYARTVLNFLAN